MAMCPAAATEVRNAGVAEVLHVHGCMGTHAQHIHPDRSFFESPVCSWPEGWAAKDPSQVESIAHVFEIPTGCRIPHFTGH